MKNKGGAKKENKQQTLQDLFALRDLFKRGLWMQGAMRKQREIAGGGWATFFCLLGGVYHLTGWKKMRSRYVVHSLRFESYEDVIHWNDMAGRTREEVLERIHTAIVDTENKIL